MAPQLTCSACTGKFGPSIFVDINNLICRFCQLREGLSKDLNTANSKIEKLTEKLETLSEFVSLNVGVKDTSTVASPTASPSIEEETTATDARHSTQENFKLVRNNVRPKRKFIPVTSCQNRFQILSDKDDETEEVRLIGDSIVRDQITEFCGRAPRTRKRYCIPGAGIDDVIAAVDEVSSLASMNTTYVIHVGTNDIQRFRSEELLDKYRHMIRKYKEKSNKIIVSGILPRKKAGHRFFDMATSINRRLTNLCNVENIGFINTWDNFFYDSSLYLDDGLHLSQVGAARFGRLLNSAVKDFNSKNENVATRQSGPV